MDISGIAGILGSGWHHFVVVLSGPSMENEFSIYQNGNKIDPRSNKINHDTYRNLRQPGLGKLVIGRQYNHEYGGYGDVILDELIFWNRPLTDDEAKSIFESYNSNGN